MGDCAIGTLGWVLIALASFALRGFIFHYVGVQKEAAWQMMRRQVRCHKFISIHLLCWYFSADPSF
jgi:hypothetical protein